MHLWMGPSGNEEAKAGIVGNKGAPWGDQDPVGGMRHGATKTR